jgi:hypothetical protein
MTTIRQTIAGTIVLVACLMTAGALDGCRAAEALTQQQKPVKELPYTKTELLDPKVRATYEGDNLNLVAFPMGGIGSGCISLSGTGKLIDWEVFNKANKGYQPRFTFLSVWAKAQDQEPR